MSGPRTKWLPKAIVLLSSLGLIGHATTALAQDVTQPPEAASAPPPPPPPIVQGIVIDPDQQRRLGLVTVNGCSATLLNRYWVLTARHCVTAKGEINGSLQGPSRVTVTAAWAPGRIAIVSRIHDLAGRAGADIVLIYLGAGDLGHVDAQPIFGLLRFAKDSDGKNVPVIGRLETTDTVIQYGRGYSTFARGVFGGTPPEVPSSGSGVYRSATLKPSAINAEGYTLAMSQGQVGHGGDSGGPTVATFSGKSVGIAGVQSTCHATGHIAKAPSDDWKWATGISSCRYDSTERFQTEIRDVIREKPGCQFGPACAIPAIVAAAFPETPGCRIRPACAIPAIVSAAMPPAP